MAAHLDSIYSDEKSSDSLFLHPAVKKSRTTLMQLLLVVLLTVACYYSVSKYLVSCVQVVGTSMVPTLQPSDFYLLNKWVYYFRQPERFEVVILRDPTDYDFCVKRIIAHEGETVSFQQGHVFVDGKKLSESYLPRGVETFPGKRDNQTIHCGANEFIVLGDNRENSLDSRVYGVVRKQNILGMLLY